jgi:hypothetical protein
VGVIAIGVVDHFGHARLPISDKKNASRHRRPRTGKRLRNNGVPNRPALCRRPDKIFSKKFALAGNALSRLVFSLCGGGDAPPDLRLTTVSQPSPHPNSR